MVTMHVSDEQSAAKYSFVDPQELELQPLKGLAPQEENAAPEEDVRLSEGVTTLFDASKWPPLPDVRIAFKDLGYTVAVPVEQTGVRTLATAVVDKLRCGKKEETKDFTLLSGLTGAVESGSMTLVIAPPGHGKTTFLRALAGSLDVPKMTQTGSVLLNGASYSESDLHLSQTIATVSQRDLHLPLLTVRETLEFAYANGNVDESLLAGHADVIAQRKNKTELIIQLLGLSESADVIVGNNLIRGISGGQKRRVTIGEALMGNHRAFLGDEITNGLDSAVAFSIVQALRTWTRSMNGMVVCTLQQPSPEIVALFDRVILLRQGQMVYNGPVAEVENYISSLGFASPPDQEIADFLVSWLADPALQLNIQVAARASPGLHPRKSPRSQLRSISNEPEVAVGDVPTTTRELVEAFQKTRFYSDAVEAADRAGARVSSNLHGFGRAQFGQETVLSFGAHTLICIKRQATVMKRNKGLIGPRIGQSVFLGLLIGTLFYQLERVFEAFPARIGLIIFSLTAVGFGNMVEVPITDEAKRVVRKQVAAGLYPTFAYIVSVLIMHVPLAAVETLVIGTIIYWITGFVSEFGRYLFYLLMVFMVNLALSVWFRTLSYLAPSIELSEASAGPSTAIFLLFGGFLITEGNVPVYLIWMYWISPFSWATRSLAINEFESSVYDEVAGPLSRRIGDIALESFELQNDPKWKWLGMVYMVCFFVLFAILSGVVLSKRKYPEPQGTRRLPEEEDYSMTREGSDDAAVAGMPTKIATKHLSVDPKLLVWRDLHYTVQVPNKEGKGTVPRKLLSGINGHCNAGDLTALMGASGAGKTTLMDVIAGRKTEGDIAGEILVNGVPKDETFGRMIGYVEQNDLHVAFSTVREALEFAARLRLPSTVDERTRNEVVVGVLDVLELGPIADRMLGNETIPGLAPGQMKKVTIGVELVANPSILFLDEPTTGLDSRTALNIMRLVKKIAQTGRAVLCTIHQPSAQIFYLFDRLVLLQTGGKEAFFGDLGLEASYLIDYLEANAPGNPTIPLRMNPADWMLQVLGAGNEQQAVDFNAIYEQSGQSQRAHDNCEQLMTRMKTSKMDKTVLLEKYAVGFGTQLWATAARGYTSHWRNTPLNGNRFFLLTFLGVVLGLTYLDINDNTEPGMRSKLGVMFMGMTMNGILNCAPQMPVVVSERAVYYRERLSNTYMSLAYSLTLDLAEVPYVALNTMMFVVPMYFMVGLKNDVDAFFSYYFAELLFCIFMSTWAQFLAVALPNRIVAGILQGVSFSIIVMFAGIFIQPNTIPSAWYWMHSINPAAKCFKALTMTQFECEDFDYDSMPPVNNAACPTVPIFENVTTKHEFALRFVSMSDYDQYWPNIGWLFLAIGILKFAKALILEKVNHLAR